MPLRAALDGTDVLAPLCSDEQWGALRSRAKTDRAALVTTCCAWQAIPKTSSRGTKHFAHRPGADCQFASETAQHLLLKSLVVQALAAAGWDASTEVAGEGWRADVLATRGPEQVAWEVQWSQQDQAETLARTERYAAAGIRTVWLFRHKIPDTLLARPDVPCFRVRERDGGEFDVEVNSGRLTIAELVAAYVGVALWPERSGWTTYRPDPPSLPADRPHDAVALGFREAAEVAGQTATVAGRAAAVAGAAPSGVVLLRPSAWALICQTAPLQPFEVQVQETRLTEAGWRPAWVTCNPPDRKLHTSSRTVLTAANPYGGERPRKRGLTATEMLHLLVGGGPREAPTYRMASTQTLDVFVWEEDCWNCDASFERVGIDGRWRSRCGHEFEGLEPTIELAEPDLGRHVREAIVDGRIASTARVEWRWAPKDQERYWANVCPACNRISIKHYNRTELVLNGYVAQDGVPLTRLDVPTPTHLMGKTLPGKHLCTSTPPCSDAR